MGAKGRRGKMKGKGGEKILNSSRVMAGMVVLLLSMAFLLFVITAPVIAQPVKVWVNAPEYVAEGGAFVATIDVDNLTDFNCGMFDLSFDSSVLIVTDVEEGHLDEETIPVRLWAHTEQNTIRAFLDIPGVTSVSGSGYLAKISFLAVGEEGDESVLNLSNGELVNNKAEFIPAEWIDAEVRIVKGVAAPTANHVHNINTSENFSSIQGAIDDPDTRDGDVIEVEDGVYYENVDVTKSLTIRSRNGSANCIVQAAKGNDNVFEITVDHACIRGFTVKGVFARGKAGINLNASHCCVSNNNCSNNDYGIHLEGANNNYISNNGCLNNWDDGISLKDANNNSLSNNNCSNNDCGIHLRKSNNNSISKNICSKNDEGIYLGDSNNNSISKNTCSKNDEGIYLRGSNNNSISDNNCINNGDNGIRLIDSDNCSISQNNCSNNLAGIFLRGSKNNKLRTNIMLENGMVIRGDSLSDYMHEIDESNRVNGKPVYYWKNIEGGRIPDGAGQVIIVNCSNVRVENQNLNNASIGIQLAFSSYIAIDNNNCSLNCHEGIIVYNSNINRISNNTYSNNGNGLFLSGRTSVNNTIWNNTISSNRQKGIYLSSSSHNNFHRNIIDSNGCGIRLDSSNNLFYLNNFMNNSENLFSRGITNNWNSPQKLNYVYNGSSYTNSMGNYWGDYNGIDANRDGLGDTSHIIDWVNKDNYPLVEPFENYFIQSVFLPVHNLNTMEDFPTIQDAIHDPDTKDGHIIEVEDNIYYENVKVTKSLTLRSKNGSANCIIQAERENDYVFEITADHVCISGFTVKGGKVGMYLSANYCNVSNNICSYNRDGIHLEDSNNNSVSNNTCYSNNRYDLFFGGDGIHLEDSNDNNISNNICSNNRRGIRLADSNNNTISNNKCSSNDGPGIALDGSNNRLTGNIMIENGIVIRGDSLSDYTHEIDESNTVNEKPVYYWKNRGGGRIPDGAGQVILVNCSNVSVENQNINNAGVGINVAFSSFISIKNNNCFSNIGDGIYLRYSNNNSISNNNCSSNSYNGIHLDDSNNNNSISNNNCSNSVGGIRLVNSNNNSIFNNNCSSNGWSGIFLWDSNNNKLTDNNLLWDGIIIVGDSLRDYTHEIDESNTVNEKPVYYWKNREGGRIPDGAGQVILVNCSNVSVENQNINNASVCIKVAFSSFITIKNNNFSNNNESGIHFDDSNKNSIFNNNCSSNGYNGIHLSASNDNTISNNNCSNNSNGIYSVASNSNTIANNNCHTNTNDGISLWFSNYNFIYLNNFINNTDNVYSFRCANVWNSTEKIAYTYNEATYTTYLGNYWSDYAGSDSDGDGIGDTRYSIDSDKDNYPLMKHYEYYFTSVENIFNQSFTLVKENRIKNDG